MGLKSKRINPNKRMHETACPIVKPSIAPPVLSICPRTITPATDRIMPETKQTKIAIYRLSMEIKIIISHRTLMIPKKKVVESLKIKG